MAEPAVQRDRITDHRKGLLITGAGAFLMTFDVPMVRLADSDAWTVIFFRGFCVFVVSFAFWWWLKKARGYDVPFVNGIEGLIAGALFAVTNITFMTAIHYTTAANAVFILAFAPLFAAILSRVFMAEPIAIYTWLAIVTAIGGMLIIALDGLGSGNTFGDVMALVASCSLAASLTIMRWSGKDMTMVCGFGSLITAAIAVWIATPFELSVFQASVLGVNSLLFMPLSLALIGLGTRYISAPEVAMLMLLDSCLAPVWVWLLIGEVPTAQVVLGGAIIVLAILFHSFAQIIRKK